ncbi:MAG: hypothetical protein PUK86_06745, partial [bacterium]|nr:hypothetical protein [bacterium]
GSLCAFLNMPPLKGEVPAAQAVGFKNADLGRFNLWRPMVVFYPAAASASRLSLGCVTFQGDLVKVVCRERKVWYNV